MSKYDPLYKWLLEAKGRSVTATFKELEQLLGFTLPETARERPQWWGNELSQDTRHTHCKAWIDAGFHAHPDLAKHAVVFKKGSNV